MAGGLAMAALSLSSCSGLGKNKGKSGQPAVEEQVIAWSEAAGEAALDKKYGFNKNDIKVDEQGNFAGGKRSQYEGKRNIAFGGGAGTASYRKTAYKAPGWSGNTTATKKVYRGNTNGSRFDTASRFDGAAAGASGRKARYSGSTVRTSSYRTGRASERSQGRVATPRDAKTQSRRETYPRPTIFTQEEYNRMSIEQTRSILGRDD